MAMFSSMPTSSLLHACDGCRHQRHDQIQTYAMVRKFDIPVNPSNTPYFKLFKQPGARQAAVAGAQ